MEECMLLFFLPFSLIHILETRQTNHNKLFLKRFRPELSLELAAMMEMLCLHRLML